MSKIVPAAAFIALATGCAYTHAPMPTAMAVASPRVAAMADTAKEPAESTKRIVTQLVKLAITERRHGFNVRVSNIQRDEADSDIGHYTCDCEYLDSQGEALCDFSASAAVDLTGFRKVDLYHLRRVNC